MRCSRGCTITLLVVLAGCKHESTTSNVRNESHLLPDTRIVPFNGANTSWRYAVDLGNLPTPAKNLLVKNAKNVFDNKVFFGQPDVPSDRLLLGQGLNSATGEPGALCVAYDADHDATEVTTTIGNADGQKDHYVLQQLTSIQSLKTAAKVDASASFGWGIFSADASASLIQSGEFTQYNNFVFAQATVFNSFQALKHRVLRDKPSLAWARSGSDVFVDHCGDEYIFGRQTGGDFTAIIQFSSSSDAEQQTVSGAINAAIGFLGGTSADFVNALQKLSSISSSRVIVIRNGGLGPIPDMAGMVNAVRHFPDDVKSHPVLISLATDPYKNVDNVPSNLSFNVVRDEARSLATLAGYLDDAYQNRANLTYIMRHQSEFIINSPDDLTKAWNDNEKIISDLMKAGNTCHDDAAHCVVPPPPTLPSFKPQRGGSGGPAPEQPQCDLRWMTVDEQGRPYTELFVVNQLHGFQTFGKFILSNPQGKIQAVDYSCDDTPNSWVCGNSFPRNGVLFTADFKRGDVEIMTDGIGFNWYRKFLFQYQNTGPTDHWLEKYTAHYALQRRVCQTR